MYAPTVPYLSYDVKKWCLEEINMLLVWSVCGTIYKLNTENVIKSFFITNGNMQLTVKNSGCSFVISSTPTFVWVTYSFVSANLQFSKPLTFSETLE